MKRAFFSFSILLLASCHSNVEQIQKTQQKALSHLHNFEVIPFFSPYIELDRDLLFKTVFSSLQKLGNVQMSKENWLLKIPSSASPLLISLTDHGSEFKVTILVQEEVEVLANQCRTSCIIWEKEFSSMKVANKLQVNVEAADLIKKAILAFGEEYSQANAEREKPLFNLQNPE